MSGFEGWWALEPDGTTRLLRDGESPTRGMDNRRVAESTVGEMWVSTVFLGLNHSYHLGGPPLLFETMVFPSQDNYSDMLCWRYSTKAEAEAGHAAVVAGLEAGTAPEDIEQPAGAP